MKKHPKVFLREIMKKDFVARLLLLYYSILALFSEKSIMWVYESNNRINNFNRFNDSFSNTVLGMFGIIRYWFNFWKVICLVNGKRIGLKNKWI